MMRQITEQQIGLLAPNPAAAANGKKLSQSGRFVRRERSGDDTFYMGECTGSGKSNYIVSADFLDPAAPVFRCSCPSRQFPCKHSLGLLYEILGGKPFDECDIPEDILQKRAKKQARAARAASDREPEGEDSGGNRESDKGSEGKNAGGEGADGREAGGRSASRSALAARTKKLKKQLEGLDLAARLIKDLVNAGLGTMGGTSLATYRQLAKQLGDYYLPGPQRLLNRLIIEIGQFQKDGDDCHYERAVEVLEEFWTLVKKSRQYLGEKLDKGQVGQDDNLLYEELGGIWKLSELENLGLTRQDVRLAQLSFWVAFDPARNEFIDTGCWADVDTGEVSLTYNYRPLKALKYVKQEDSFFGVARIPRAAYYPGQDNRRVRWESAQVEALAAEDIASLRSHAAPDVASAAKAAKNYLKNAMSAPVYFRLVRFSRIGTCAQGLVLADPSGGTILLGDMPEMEQTVHRLSMLPGNALVGDGALLGGFWYDKTARRIRIHPCAVITDSQVIRLLY